MNTEEKARAYDEALERARKQRADYQKDLDKTDKGSQLAGLLSAGISALELAFPELAESEDDRIRNWLKKEIVDKYVEDGIVNSKLADDALGWLEKQKHLYETTKDRFYREGFEEGQLYERQKEPAPIPDKFSGLKSLMLQYLQSAANRKDDTEIEDDTDLYGRKILDYVWKYDGTQKEQKSMECSDEDARVVKRITNLLHTGGYLEEPDRSAVFAWLEKQKINTEGDFGRGYNCGYEACLHSHGAEWFEKQKEQKPTEKQDYSGLNELERVIHRGFLCAGVENVPVVLIKETTQECLTQIQPAEWSEEDKTRLKVITEELERFIMFNSYGTPLSVDDISWLESLPERFNIQPKQEWSEEKKQTIKNTHPEEYPSSPAECISPREYGLFKQLQQECIETIEQELYSLGKEHEKDDDPRIKFLKSIRPSWKPSEEHIGALQAVINDPNNAGSESCQLALKSLLERLKKL